jgi:xanthine dehydrogenase accessory factor
MDTIDLLVLRTLRDWRVRGLRAVLATVVHTWGSSPRPVGAMMALREDGRVVGSVSGGCIEDDLIRRYTLAQGGGALPSGAPTFVRYGVNADEAHRFGLPCGGTLELLLEFDPAPEALTALVAPLDAGELVRRTVQCDTGLMSLASAPVAGPLHVDSKHLSVTLGPGYRMLLIGAGTLTQYLATMAGFNGFRVSVCDPRTEYRSGWMIPDVAVIDDMPDDAVIRFRPNARTCVIALSHDPKLDDLALMQALHTPAFYVGAIGSRRNSDARRERLATHFGETEATLARLRGPIGLYIGSKTPAEIAVSVMAEVLAVKNGVGPQSGLTVAQGKAGDEEKAA